MKRFQTEEELHHYIETCLEKWGIHYEHEKVCTPNGLRADIVVDDAVIEVKKVLLRESLYQALGQGLVYQQQLQKPYILIMGQSPLDSNEAQQAQRIAADMERNPQVEVVFIDREPGWGLVEQESSSTGRIRVCQRVLGRSYRLSWIEQFILSAALSVLAVRVMEQLAAGLLPLVGK